MRKSKGHWESLQTSFWFVPGLMLVCSSALAIALIGAEPLIGDSLVRSLPLLFAVNPEGARGILSAIAGSMMTVAGVAFSMTLVALALAASQYSSRVLRTFMRDRVTQFTLGSFAGIFAYCLIVLRTIRGANGNAEFVPSLAVSFSVLLAIAGIGVLILFIHHIASSIQAASIIGSVAKHTLETIEDLFPQNLGDAPHEGDDDPDIGQGPDDSEDSHDSPWRSSLAAETWQPIPAPCPGYIENVDGEVILRLAREHETIVRMEKGIGDFVVADAALASLALQSEPDDKLVCAIQDAYSIGRHRTLASDAGFGIRQLVDIAIRALSPSMNDTTTAVMCVDYLSAILARLAAREIPSPYRFAEGKLRVIAKRHSFEDFVASSLDEIRDSGAGNVTILIRMLHTLETVADFTSSWERRDVLDRHAQRIAELAERSLPALQDRMTIEDKVTTLRRALATRASQS